VLAGVLAGLFAASLAGADLDLSTALGSTLPAVVAACVAFLA
jgi:hypothetical protein